MRRSWFYFLGIVVLAVSGLVLWQFFPMDRQLNKKGTAAPTGAADENIGEPIKPIPPEIKLDKKKVALGDRLFHDPQLSKDNTVACATCHNLSKAGVDGLPKSKGIGDAEGDVNAPTVFNSGFNFKQFWDGRADTLEQQVDGPVQNPKEMGTNYDEIIVKLQKDPGYVAAFKSLYLDGITADNIKDAIATFERSLTTPRARFDQYLRGDENALTEKEKAGYKLFKNLGCIVCHQGVNVGGNMFQTFGKFGNYLEDRGNITKADYGRFNVTHDERDRYKFKVPSLRNVEATAPYFHDGQTKTLEEAVQTMSRYQLGRALSGEQIGLIVDFLKSLTGEYDGQKLNS